MKKILLVFLMIGLLILTIIGTASVSGRKVYGYVTDKEEQPIEDVTVIATGIDSLNSELPYVRIDKTNEDGYYEVEVAYYYSADIKFSKIGYQTVCREVGGGKSGKRLDITLDPFRIKSRNMIAFQKIQFIQVHKILIDRFPLLTRLLNL